ncbi:MAG TPA: PEP-CTERM sorting domain-containing protein [Thermoguttaceae bacterium]|nr:PEP-CTERM sorting domain-containing protein [Thermoguttaceae bacterium]
MWTTRCVVPFGAGLVLCLCFLLSVEAIASDPLPGSPLEDVNGDDFIDGQDLNAFFGEVGDPPQLPVEQVFDNWPGAVAEIDPSTGEIFVSVANVYFWSLGTKDVDGDTLFDKLFDADAITRLADVFTAGYATEDQIFVGSMQSPTSYSYLRSSLGTILVSELPAGLGPITADNINDYFELTFTLQDYSTFPGTLVFVPEPGTLAMLAFGGIGGVLWFRRRRRK